MIRQFTCSYAKKLWTALERRERKSLAVSQLQCFLNLETYVLGNLSVAKHDETKIILSICQGIT